MREAEPVLLRAVIKNLWEVYQYHQAYQLFLLGVYSEEAFRAIAETHATSFYRMPPERLMWAATVLLQVLDTSLTSSDLSVLLKVDPADIDQALRASAARVPLL